MTDIKKLTGIVTTVGAAAGAAQAGIVNTPQGGSDGLLDNAGDIVPIDFDGDGNREVEMQYTEPATGNLNIKIEAFPETDASNVTDEILVDPTASAGNSNNPLALAFGELIDEVDTINPGWQFIGRTDTGTSVSGVSGSNGGGNFRFGDGEQFIGVRTLIDGNTHYGWIGVIITDEFNDGSNPANDRLTGTITGYAYESTPNLGIVAGAIPAPGAAALLAIGAMGMGGRRSRRVTA